MAMSIRTAVFGLIMAAVQCETANAEDLHSMMLRCVPQVHPTTMSAIVAVESKASAYIIADSGPAHLPWAQRKTMLRSFDPPTKEEAVRIVETLLKQGHLVDIGVSQVNVRNIAPSGVSIGDAFDPCTNLRLGGQVLVAFYLDALKKFRAPDKALLAAISAYNTGSFVNGFGNGYVQKVVNASRVQVPALRYGGVRGAGRSLAAGARPSAAPGAATPRSSLLDARMAKLEVESF